MIAALLLLVQAVDTTSALTIQGREGPVRVPVVYAAAGRLLAASQIAAPLGITLRPVGNGRYRVAAGGAEVELTVGVPFARIGNDVTPLSSAPVVNRGELYVPLSLVTDVLPRVAAGFLYDARRFELRRFEARVANGAVDSARSRASPRGKGTPSAASGTAARPRSPTRTVPVVVVDAGHGGPDRGMKGPLASRKPFYEADLTLQIARRVKEELEAKGIRVVMTRDRDTLISLADRGRIANRVQGQLFLSIHVNAANPRWRNPGGARGFETYFLAEAKTDDERRVEAMENESVKYEAEAETHAGDPLSFILNDMKQNEHLRESSELAATVQQAIAGVHPAPNRGVKQAGFRVLVSAFMPAVLIEVGFGTNHEDAAFIASADGQRRLSRAIASATADYLAALERRMSAGQLPEEGR